MKEVGAFALLLVIYAVADLISNKTKGIVSSLFTSSVVILIALWLGLPKTVFADSGLVTVGTVCMGMLIVHMGTLISIKDFARQWKTVIIAASALVGVFVFVYLIGQLIVGKQYAVAATPPIAGGVIAALIMSNGANALNLPMVSLLALLLLVLQGFVGYPVASFCLKKEAKLLAKQYKESNGAAGTGADAGFGEEVEIRPKYRFIPELPKSAQTPYMLLAKVSLTALFSYWFAGALGGVIDKNIMCLLIGIIFTEIGFLEKDILTKANSFGLAMAGLITVVFANLAKATPDMVVQIIEPILITLVLGVIGIGVFSILAGKLLGESWPMSFAIGATALFGFPGTYVLSTEVSKSIGGSEQEKKYIMNNIFPKMMIAGFVTVTVGSVILAGIMVKML